MLDNQKNPKIIGCQALNNNGKGIWLKNSAGAVIESNTLVMNTLYGIQDEAPAGLSVFIGNGARFNGSVQADNFVGMPNGTPIRSWTFGSIPESASSSLENTGISLK